MGGRARTSDLAAKLREDEGNDDLQQGAIYVAVNNANRQAEATGERKRFHTYREGEQRGWIRLELGSQYARGSAAKSIEESIYEANRRLDEQLRQRFARMSWRTFESNFLRAVLEKLGFQDVVITQASRDGGYDATAAYRRGLVDAQALVSAKHWSRPVSVEEVRMMRGIKGPQDTAIIVTTSTFTQDARNEAKPGQNQRVVYLIDGETLVRICKENQIGVRREQLPELFVLEEDEFSNERTDKVGAENAAKVDDGGEDEEYEDDEENEDGEEVGEEDAEELAPAPRLYASMLGNDERGLSVDEIAKLLKLSPLTVRSYLSVPKRRKDLADRIRDDPKLRARALKYLLKRQAAALEEVADDEEDEELLEDELEEAEDDAVDATEETEDDPYQRRHLREAMLGDSERGLSIDDIAKLLKLSPVTVRVYLGDDRRKDLADRIRQDPKLRQRALRLIERRRTQ